MSAQNTRGATGERTVHATATPSSITAERGPAGASTFLRSGQRMALSGWGRLPIVPGAEVLSEDLTRVSQDLPFARGLGRAYGDAALPATGDYYVAGTTLADRILAFDAQTGVLSAEAGLSLDQICELFLPRGYFTPVSPGTRFVTLGGMVACDVHGKNAHRDGTFGRHVLSLKMRVADGSIVTCSQTLNEDLYAATIGGMGLTGAILEVTVRLVRVPSPWILEERECVCDLDELLDSLKLAAATWPMTVAWLDCLVPGHATGRGVVLRGRWAEPDEVTHIASPPRRWFVPFEMPPFVLNRNVMRAFNALSYRRQVWQAPQAVVHPYTHLYPLDAITHWPRLYGRHGFIQYQCVLPEPHARDATHRFIRLLQLRDAAPFLAVIKDCGLEGPGMLSFPRPGISIAVDMPMRSTTQALVDALNEFVIAEGGRIYLAKDALTRAEHFRAMEPRVEAFLAIRRRWDPSGRIRSAQSIRLFGW